MADRPILFSAPMVRALLDGRKTQTRRLVKPQPVVHPAGNWSWEGRNGGFVGASGTHLDEGFPEAARSHARIQTGDRLWVRETWTAQMTHGWTIADARSRMYREKIFYAADGKGSIDGWWPSIHMPREFSRLTLTVTDVRVQRLLAINEEDAIAEGIEDVTREVAASDHSLRFWKRYRDGGWNGYVDSAVASYASLWTEINGAGSWEANPWVAAYTFTVVRQNIDAKAGC